jgi:hypothetical protein
MFYRLVEYMKLFYGSSICCLKHQSPVLLLRILKLCPEIGDLLDQLFAIGFLWSSVYIVQIYLTLKINVRVLNYVSLL